MKHLDDTGENYFIHAFFALTYAVRLLWLSIIAVVHALFPMILTNTTSDGVDQLSADIEYRRIRNLKPGLTR
jgi:hypothetical protein